MNTLRDAKASCRAILGDPDGDWTIDSYLNPIVNHCYELIILDLSETCSPYITKVAVVPNIQPGTSDLSDQQNDPSKPLYGLMDVFQQGVDWKLHGSPDTSYQPVAQVDKLPSTQPRTVAIDLRVRGEFRPPPLLAETDVCAIHPMMSTALAEQAAACSMRERANPGQMQLFQLVGSDVLDNIKNQLMRSQQGTMVRLGQMNRNNRQWPGQSGWYTSPNFYSPMLFEWRAYKLWITP